MDVQDLVTAHYGARGPSQMILAALASAGTDLERLRPEHVFALDQLHAGGLPAARHVVERVGAGPGTRLLDVGSGIGGPARLAATYGAQVTGIDLTPAFVEAATDLTERVGLDDRATFVTTPGQELPFADASFDAAMMVHVGMNIPDKAAVFAEVHRVLTPGGLFGVFEQMRTGDGDLPYPMPWAVDERSSFVERVEDYRSHLEGAGFTVEAVEDRTASTLGPPPVGPLSPQAVFGEEFVRRVGNNVAATRAGLLGAILVVASA